MSDPTYTIAGKISGPVLAGVTVTATRGDGCDGMAISASDGTWTIANLWPGRYLIAGALSGYAFTRRHVDVGPSAESPAWPLDLEGAVTYDVSGTIAGPVKGGVTVTVLPGPFERDTWCESDSWRRPRPVALSAVSASDGTWLIAGVLPGKYVCYPSFEDHEFRPATIPVMVGAANVTGLSFTIEPLLALIKSHLQIGYDTQDRVIRKLTEAAEVWLARWMNVLFANREIEEMCDGGQKYLYLHNGNPVTNVLHVHDTWETESELGFERDNDRVLHLDCYHRALFRWEPGALRYRVTYRAGYLAIPADVRLAILMLVARAFNARAGQSGESISGASVAWQSLLDSDIGTLIRPHSRRKFLSY